MEFKENDSDAFRGRCNVSVSLSGSTGQKVRVWNSMRTIRMSFGGRCNVSMSLSGSVGQKVGVGNSMKTFRMRFGAT